MKNILLKPLAALAALVLVARFGIFLPSAKAAPRPASASVASKRHAADLSDLHAIYRAHPAPAHVGETPTELHARLVAQRDALASLLRADGYDPAAALTPGTPHRIVAIHHTHARRLLQIADAARDIAETANPKLRTARLAAEAAAASAAAKRAAEIKAKADAKRAAEIAADAAKRERWDSILREAKQHEGAYPWFPKGTRARSQLGSLETAFHAGTLSRDDALAKVRPFAAKVANSKTYAAIEREVLTPAGLDTFPEIPRFSGLWFRHREVRRAATRDITPAERAALKSRLSGILSDAIDYDEKMQDTRAIRAARKARKSRPPHPAAKDAGHRTPDPAK